MKKVCCIMFDGFEELEAVGAIALLRRANIQVDLFTKTKNQATGRFDLTLANLQTISQIEASDYDALLLPGGPHYAALEKDETVISTIRAFHNANRLICAICAAPTMLGRMGLLKGKKYTCFTSMNEDYQGFYQDQYVAIDTNLITGRSAAAVIDFAFAIIEQLEGKQHAEKVKQEIYYYQK